VFSSCSMSFCASLSLVHTVAPCCYLFATVIRL
jgi:hypothetical protein